MPELRALETRGARRCRIFFVSPRITPEPPLLQWRIIVQSDTEHTGENHRLACVDAPPKSASLVMEAHVGRCECLFKGFAADAHTRALLDFEPKTPFLGPCLGRGGSECVVALAVGSAVL